MINVILFGPPGSGKGTQAIKLAEAFELIHISTGDLFRYEIGNNTELGLKAKAFMDNGELVPDDVTIGMLKNKMDKHPEANGFILDGFPRTVAQAQALDVLLEKAEQEIKVLISLEVSEDEIVSRLLERGKTSGRSDDLDESIIKNRFQVYKEQTVPVFDHYAGLDKAVSIGGEGSIEDISKALAEIVKNF